MKMQSEKQVYSLWTVVSETEENQYTYLFTSIWHRNWRQDFPGGLVVKNSPDNAGDMSSSHDPGRLHMLWSNQAFSTQLSPPSRAHKLQLPRPGAATTEAPVPRTRVLQQEKPLQWEACIPPWKAAPTHN